jgi:hypothetical protein
MNKGILLFVFILLFGACNDDALIQTPAIPIKTIKVIQDNFENIPIVVVSHEKAKLLISFKRSLMDGTVLEFTTSSERLPIILEDTEGNKWDIQGKCLEGNRLNQQLERTDNWVGYWFALSSSFPNAEIYNEPLINEPFLLNSPSPNWLVSLDDIYSGAPKDGIVAIDKPEFYTVSDFFKPNSIVNDNFYLVDTTLVTGIIVNGEAKAYPHAVLNWHEIVNDYVGGIPISVMYCPLTGTSSAWNRTVNGQVTTFGVSGLLYNSNVLPYDRLSNSAWQQILTKCVSGVSIGQIPETYQIIETTWEYWVQIHPTTLILSDNTPQSHNCSIFPYGSYETSPRVAYPLLFDDNRRFSKERVHAVIINGKAKIYPFDVFE